MRNKRLIRGTTTKEHEQVEEETPTLSRVQEKCQILNQKTKTKQLSKKKEPCDFVNTSTPAKSRAEGGFSDDTDEDISHALRDTPTALKMKNFFHDELLSSQTGDAQVDVRWEHTSPDAYKYLQRVHRKQKKEDLSDIVCIMAPAFNGNGGDDQLVSSTPPLLSSWLQANKATSNNMPFEGQEFKPNQRAKRTMKKKRRAGVQKFDDILSNLHLSLERFDDEDTKVGIKRTSLEGESEKTIDTNRNIVMSSGIDGSSLLPKDAALALLEEEDEMWSDEELFQDNSFILQATQLPVDSNAKFSTTLFGGKRKQVSPIAHQPLHKTKKCGVSPPWEKDDIIPPTCPNSRSLLSRHSTFKGGPISGNVETKPGSSASRTNVYNNMRVNKNVPKFMDVNQQSSRVTRSNTSPFRKHSSFSACGVPGDNPNGLRNSKSPWRKTSSFSGRDTSCHTDTQGPVTRNALQLQNTSSNQRKVAPAPVTRNASVQRRSTNGAQSESANVVNDLMRNVPGCPTNNNSTRSCVNSVKMGSNGLTNTKLKSGTKAMNTAQHRGNAKHSTRAEHAAPSATRKAASPVGSPRSQLDTSLSDEILRQLAEPDELLESQATTEPLQKMSDKSLGELEAMFGSESESDFSIHADDNDSIATGVPGTSNWTREVSADSKSVSVASKNNETKTTVARKTASATAIAAATVNKTGGKTGSCSSSRQVPASQNRFKFHSSKNQQASVSRGRTSTSPRLSTAVVDPVPGPATLQGKDGVKTAGRGSEIHAKNTESVSTDDSAETFMSDTQVLMSSQVMLEDDSFMKDDALFESQIIAMLDEVEYGASQQTSSQSEDSEKISCSPVEIEKKRLAAMEKLKKKKKR